MIEPNVKSNQYRRLHEQHQVQQGRRLASAERVLGLLFEQLSPTSILDVGCGLGTWLKAAQRQGVNLIRGVEGPWLQPGSLCIDPSCVIVADLEQPFDLGQRFDLVLSIEVAEHLRAEAAQPFVASLVRHGDFVLFSAAVPFQPGTGHINLRFPDYWAGLFAQHGHRPLDLIRRRIWWDRTVDVWIRQNVLLFASEHAIGRHRWAQEARKGTGPLSIVHPELFMAVMRKQWVRRNNIQKSLA